jgi:hypothetical protein
MEVIRRVFMRGAEKTRRRLVATTGSLLPSCIQPLPSDRSIASLSVRGPDKLHRSSECVSVVGRAGRVTRFRRDLGQSEDFLRLSTQTRFNHRTRLATTASPSLSRNSRFPESLIR